MNKGDKIRVKKGVRLWTTHPWKDGWYENGRTRTVTIHHVVNGWGLQGYEVFNHPTYMKLAEEMHGMEKLLEMMEKPGYEQEIIQLHHPRAVWVGTGGYWVEVQQCNVEVVK